MSTPNFTTQEDFNLFLWDYSRPDDEVIDENIIASEYRDITSKEDITEYDRNDFVEEQYYWECRDIVDTFEDTVSDILKTLKRELQFFKVVLKDGYYCGFQFYVEEDSEILKDYYFEDITNEETRYYLDTTLSEFKRKYQSEINFINKKLLPKLAKFYGFEQYNCVGIFSNGEAIYRKVDNNPRTAIKKVA